MLHASGGKVRHRAPKAAVPPERMDPAEPFSIKIGRVRLRQIPRYLCANAGFGHAHHRTRHPHHIRMRDRTHPLLIRQRDLQVMHRDTHCPRSERPAFSIQLQRLWRIEGRRLPQHTPRE